MDRINNESTPLVVNSGQLKIALLNINRNLTPLLFTSYIDETESEIETISGALDEYKAELDWFKREGHKRESAKSYTENITGNTESISLQLQKVITLHLNYLDLTDRALFARNKAELMFQQMNNMLSSGSVRGAADNTLLEELQSQVGVMEVQSKFIFTLKESVEIKPELKSFLRREPRFAELIDKVRLYSPELNRLIGNELNALKEVVFAQSGALSLHYQTSEAVTSVLTERANFEQLLDLQLEAIDEMTVFARKEATELYNHSVQQFDFWFNTIAAVVSFSLLLTLASGYAIARMIRQPALQINGTLDEVAVKNLSVRVGYLRENELGKIGQKVNLMITQLSDFIGRLTDSSGQLDAVSERNKETGEKLSSSMKEQSRQISLVASAMEEMEMSVQEIAEASGHSFDRVSGAVASSRLGQEKMHTSIGLVKSLAEQLEQSTSKVQQLRNVSAGIGSVLEVISNISEQTNLLALNAAIEAARAGEQGRGFAVVADEVRVLASRTTDSTEEIREQIETLVNSAEIASGEILSCNQTMEAYSHSANEVNGLMEQIHSSLEEIEKRSMQIASASGQHKTAAGEVTQSIGKIQTISKSNSESARELALLSSELKGMAASQAELTRMFRI